MVKPNKTIRKLTREELIQGANYIKTINLTSIKDSQVTIRPLKQSEVQEYQEMSVAGMPNIRVGSYGAGNNVEVNLQQSTAATNKAQLWAVARALTLPDKEEYTPADVGFFRGDVFKEIWEAVSELSGLDSSEVERTVDKFH